MKSPFPTCAAKEHLGSWRIESPFWTVQMVGEMEAKRTAEIIRGAYDAGRRDKMSEVRSVLLGPDIGD